MSVFNDLWNYADLGVYVLFGLYLGFVKWFRFSKICFEILWRFYKEFDNVFWVHFDCKLLTRFY